MVLIQAKCITKLDKNAQNHVKIGHASFDGKLVTIGRNQSPSHLGVLTRQAYGRFSFSQIAGFLT
jgi:hypothetical protein